MPAKKSSIKNSRNDGLQASRKKLNVFVYAFLPLVFVAVISLVSLISHLEFEHVSRVQAEQAALKHRYEKRVELCRQKWPLRGHNYQSCVHRIIH
jgi:hypothetical protein